MNFLSNRLLSLVFALLFLSGCKGQNEPKEDYDRQPAFAGKFYPSSKEELTKLMEGYFSLAEKPITLPTGRQACEPLAVIVPHAGYVYSGLVAATTYKQISRDRVFKHVFIIGSSHTMFFNGASVYTRGSFITPLGRVPVDDLASELVANNNFLTDNIQPHVSEHSLEVQLPFMQYWLTNPFSIVPIIIGGESQETCQRLAKALGPYFSEENLFVISTDFSHYPESEDAIKSDHTMADAVISNSAEKFLQAKAICEDGSTPNEITAMCGWTSVLTLLNITEKKSDIDYSEVIFKNSGDSPYGEKDKVVGYVGICACRKQKAENESAFRLDDTGKMELLKIARSAITEYINKGNYSSPDESKLPPDILVPAGAFVTLKKNGELRGCIGNFNADKLLYKTVEDMAIAAATQDPRFMPVTSGEIPKLEIEISVLTPMKKINSIDEIVLGKHGIYIKRGFRGGTFLPQVADETGWTKEEFLGHCAQDKAMIGWYGWKNADIYTYEALVFGEHEFK